MTQISAPTSHDSIVESLELIAERAGDINPQILKRYFDKCPSAAQLMDHMDSYMLGRMLDQVLLLVMESDDAELENYLRFETASHHSYGVENTMYEKLFEAVFEVARDSCAESWNERYQEAWQLRLDTLLARIIAADAAYLRELAAS